MSAAPAPSPAATTPASPFEALAASYDETFGTSAIGTVLRRALWRRYDALFGERMRVLDLGCGTGDDALRLAGRGVRVLGIDAAEAMASRAGEKAKASGVSGASFRALPIEALDALSADAPFDGAYSSFGPWNCVRDVSVAGESLARLLAPGAPVVLCVMGRHVPWEWLHHVARGDARRAFRRLSKGGVEWRGLRVSYPTPGELRRALAPWFDTTRVWALGALVPPTYVEAWAARHPKTLALLDRAERALERVPPLPSLADHYVLELTRRP